MISDTLNDALDSIVRDRMLAPDNYAAPAIAAALDDLQEHLAWLCLLLVDVDGKPPAPRQIQLRLGEARRLAKAEKSASARIFPVRFAFPVLVGKKGVTIFYEMEPFTYRSRETDNITGQNVMVNFNPHRPEAISIFPRDRETPIRVPRCEPSADALNALGIHWLIPHV